jgi:tetratricopeptide (TPR) repeat protein
MLGPRNQLDEAIAHLQKVVEINPRNGDAYHNLSVAYGLQRRLDPAIAAAQEAVRLKPDFAPARVQLRQLLAARGRR